MSYPNAFCVKCGTHTETLSKHTVLLQNNSRALRGVCKSCESDVYKILPKIKEDTRKSKLTEDEKRRYPDAYCVKCQTHTPTVNAHTVILDNMSRAVTGACKCCGSEVYRIIGGKADIAPVKLTSIKPTALKAFPTAQRASPTFKVAPSKEPKDERRIPVTRRADEASGPSQWTYLFAAGVIFGIVAGFLVLTVL